jgi:WD40 repeat protein
VARCAGHREGVWQLAVSPDCKTIVSSGTPNAVHVWDLATGKLRYRLFQNGKERGSYNLAFLPDGKTFLTLTDLPNDPVRFWDVATGKPVSPIKRMSGK